jgi:hypothetical protein
MIEVPTSIARVETPFQAWDTRELEGGGRTDGWRPLPDIRLTRGDDHAEEHAIRLLPLDLGRVICEAGAGFQDRRNGHQQEGRDPPANEGLLQGSHE